MSKGNATAKLTSLNGISGFDLYLNDSDKAYGHYPLDVGFDGASQLKMAIDDAKDYGYDGIEFIGA